MQPLGTTEKIKTSPNGSAPDSHRRARRGRGLTAGNRKFDELLTNKQTQPLHPQSTRGFGRGSEIGKPATS
jgi:hypothetical protein